MEPILRKKIPRGDPLTFGKPSLLTTRHLMFPKPGPQKSSEKLSQTASSNLTLIIHYFFSFNNDFLEQTVRFHSTSSDFAQGMTVGSYSGGL
jgi:hypothetical protein